GGGGGGQPGAGAALQERQGGTPREHQPSQPPAPIVATGETRGWFDPARDGGFIRRANNSYLTEAGDAYVPPHLVRQFGIRKADAVDATTGLDHRGRSTAADVRAINDGDPALAA